MNHARIMRGSLLAGMLSAIGCGPGVPPTTVADDQIANSCPSPAVSTITGNGAPGDGCVHADTDCAPVCCDCANNDGFEYLASECDLGECTGGGTACADAEAGDSSLCP